MSATVARHYLAAILAADVAGYSRLMSRDERSTISALDAAREVFRSRIQENHGRVIDMAGDSVLAVFETAVGALEAAQAIQDALKPQADAAPADRQLRFRIGIHLGDVIEKTDGTVYGDGVNIAARVQTKAPPGGICLSQTVYDTVKNKMTVEATFGGRESFKNIATPVPIWLIFPGGAPAPAQRRPWLAAALVAVLVVAGAGGWYWSHRTPSRLPAVSDNNKSLAVLCFTNMSEDKAMTYFADGIHEDLLTQLALLGDLKVVSRTSVLEYRDTRKNIRQIGAELGVGALLEGSVRRAGNRVRVTAQLIDARSDQHLWAKSYDRELKDIFAIQSELATEIARSLRVSLAPHEEARLAKKPTENLEAYDLFLHHQELANQAASGVRAATRVKDRIAVLTKAVDLDPKFALAWARLAAEHARAYGFGVDQTPARRVEAAKAMERALALAPNDPQIKIEQGVYYLRALNDEQQAEQAYRDVLATAPNNVDALIGLADVLFRNLRWSERVPVLERALSIDPRNVPALVRLANGYRLFRQYDRARDLRKRLADIRPGDIEVQANLYLLDYLQTGSWAAYDKWRSTIPADASAKYFRVSQMDAERAIARGDFDEAMRLYDLIPDDLRGSFEGPLEEASRELGHALIYRAKGDQPRSIQAAKKALSMVDPAIARSANIDNLWYAKALAHALLGQRELAYMAHAREVAAASVAGLSSAEFSRRRGIDIKAVLGERDEAIAELARQLKLPGGHPHSAKVKIEFVSLWDDPRFLALVNDPANNAPLAFTVPAYAIEK